MKNAQLRQTDPPGATLVFRLDPAEVVASAGVGGWQEIDHPKRGASTEFGGQPLRVLTIEALFDGWRRQQSVEEPCRILDVWGRILPGRREPAVLALDYGSYSQTRWVVNGLSWGESLRGPNGVRLRQAVTIELLEYQDALTALSPVRRAKPAAGRPTAPGRPSSGAPVRPSGQIYTVVAGDTLARIAQRELGSASRWPEIARLQVPPLRDPDRLTVGQRIRLPA